MRYIGYIITDMPTRTNVRGNVFIVCNNYFNNNCIFITKGGGYPGVLET